MRQLFVLALLVSALSVGVAADPPAPSAKLYNLTVNRPPTGVPPGLIGNEHIHVRVYASLPSRSIIGLHPAACKVALTDDKGTELTGARNFGMAMYVQTDMTKAHATFALYSPKRAAAGATKVRVKGDFVFLCGVGEKTATAENFILRDKEKVTLGPAVFTVTKQNDRTQITMAADQPLVKSVTFLDPDGKPLPISGFLNLTPGAEEKVTQTGLYFPMNVQAVGMKVVHYEKVESVTVPIDSELGLGG